MNAAETRASSAIALCTELTVVSRSRTTAEIDTFISDVSTTSTNIAAASTSDKRVFPAIRSLSAVMCRPHARAEARGRLRRSWMRLDALREPRLGGGQVADGERPRSAGHQERQHAQRRLHPRLVGHHGHALELLGVPGPEAGVGLHGVALDVVGARPEQVEQTQ